MKKLWVLFVFTFCCLPFLAYGLEVPRLQGYVNDYAGIISPSARSRIEEELRAFERSDSTQIVILTVPTLGGENIEEFGMKVAEAWKIGQERKDNGILFIVSKEERKIRIEVGRGLEGKLTDLMAGRIIDQVIKPRFKQGNFDAGFIAGASALIAGTRGEFKAEQRSGQRRQQGGLPPFFTFLLFFGIFVLFLGAFSRILGGIAGAIGLPTLVYLTILPVGALLIVLLAVLGFSSGFFLPGLFSSGRSRKDGQHRDHGGGFFFGPGAGGFSTGGGGFDGGFSGGGGSFGGGGASGDW